MMMMIMVMMVVVVMMTCLTASRPCREGMRRCSTTQRCIRGDYFCDGDNDCGDYSDERRDICRELLLVYVATPNIFPTLFEFSKYFMIFLISFQSSS